MKAQLLANLLRYSLYTFSDTAQDLMWQCDQMRTQEITERRTGMLLFRPILLATQMTETKCYKLVSRQGWLLSLAANHLLYAQKDGHWENPDLDFAVAL